MNYELYDADLLDLKLKTLEYRLEQLQSILNEEVFAKTNSGKIQGVKRRSIYDDEFYSFERIPYAEPPLGELRFRAPKPVTPWKNVRNCAYWAGKPMQRSITLRGGVEGSEDCLYLNVYTNNMKPIKSRPVMVWIYGGGFQMGEATREWYAPDYFMKQDVVLVTVSYRLGALGFLSLYDSTQRTPGNAGLKDLVLALKWIKHNCANFGGNPECITVFGESAGGASTILLMLAEVAKGLFHRAIAQSGVATSDFPTFDCARHAYAFAQAAGYVGENTDAAILKYLLDCTAEQIVNAEEKCMNESKKSGSDMIEFGPTIEPFDTPHSFMVRSPEQLMKCAWGNSIPLMIGNNTKEGLFFLPMAKHLEFYGGVDLFMKNCEQFVPKLAVADPDGPELKEKGLKLRQLHVSGESATTEEYYEILSYAYFWHPVQKTINSRLKYANKMPTFLYRFDFESEKLEHTFRLLRWGRGVPGVSHTDDLAYLFRNILSRRMESNSREYRTIQRMIAMWTTFAATGNPNVATTDTTGTLNVMKDVYWKPLSRADAEADATWKCLNISDELTFIDLPEMPKLKVWQELYTAIV